MLDKLREKILLCNFINLFTILKSEINGKAQIKFTNKIIRFYKVSAFSD